MNIGSAARASGVTVKMIRYYESIGLIAPAHRTDSGYRDFSEADVHTLRFIKRARNLGFSVAQMKELLALWHDRQRPARSVKRLALEHIDELEKKVAELRSMITTLSRLADNCHGDDRPACPILDELVDGEA